MTPPTTVTAPHVLHVFQAIDRGGAELRTLDLLRALQGENLRTTIATLSGRKGSLASEFEALGAAVVPLPLSIGFPLRAVRLFRRTHPTAVHSHVATFSGVVMFFAWLAGVPQRIAHFRSDGDAHGESLRRRLQRAVMRWLIRHFATDVIAASPGALVFALSGGTPAGVRVAVVPNGVTVDRDDAVVQAPSIVPPIRICHVGRSIPEKNRDKAVRVLAECNSRVPASLTLIGPMSDIEQASLRALSDRLDVSQLIDATGEVSDVRRRMSAHNILLTPSTREGLPGAVLEALSIGLPCLTSDLSGATWIADNLPGVSLLSVSMDDPTWAEHVIRIATADTLDARRERQSALRQSTFAIDNVVPVFRDLWGMAAVSARSVASA